MPSARLANLRFLTIGGVVIPLPARNIPRLPEILPDQNKDTKIAKGTKHEGHEARRRRWPVKIRQIVEGDRADWVRMRDALWPGSLSDHEEETRHYFDARQDVPIVLVAEVGDRLVGFLELDVRKYAPGCRSSPVPFIEGWYVEPVSQRRGIGRALIEAAEREARAAGYSEIASDAEADNATSIAAHLALGYEAVERVVCFRRSLRAPTERG